jgi:hypothetical protein
MANSEKEKRHDFGIGGFEERKSLRKGDILRLRDDCRPSMKTRYWVFQDLFMGGEFSSAIKMRASLRLKKSI